jgi:uncharacterized protein
MSTRHLSYNRILRTMYPARRANPTARRLARFWAAPILERCLAKVPGGRPHIPADRAAPLTDFEAVAARYPAFCVVRLEPIDHLSAARGARPRARPRPGKRLPGSRIADALLPRLQPAAARQIVGTAATGTFTDITHARHHLLVTYRRDGSPVPTTVWAASGKGCLYVRTERASGKVRRIRHDPRALVTAATVRGRPLSPPMAVSARVLEADEEATAEAALAMAHGWYRILFENRADRLRVDMCYLELKPMN